MFIVETGWAKPRPPCHSLAKLCLKSSNLSNTPAMALGAGEPRLDVRANQFERELRANHASAQAQDVHVVIFHALARGERIVAGSRANPAELIGGHASSGAASADQ